MLILSVFVLSLLFKIFVSIKCYNFLLAEGRNSLPLLALLAEVGSESVPSILSVKDSKF